MPYPERPSHLADRRWRVLVVCLIVLILACSGDEPAEGQPSTLRVLKAVATKLLSNTVRVSPEKSERTSGKTSETAGETSPQEMVADTPGLQTAAEPRAQARALVDPEPAETCPVPYRGKVTIIPVRTPTALQRSIADRPRVPIVYETDDTAIWQDGRVLTLDLESLGTHLNAVGWASNPIEILGTGSRPGASSANLGWSSSRGSSSKKRRRRRG